MEDRFIEAASGSGAENGRLGLTPDATGKFHWYYEMNMFTNPTLFITLMKVFGGIVVGMGLFVSIIGSDDSFIDFELLLKFWLYGLGLMVALVGVSYAIYAAIMGGKYCVVFEMDDDRIVHNQLARQFKKAQVIAGLAALVGVAKGSPTMVGTGLLAGSRSTMTTTFRNVSKLKVSRLRRVIYLKSCFEWNQIYAQKEIFDDVLSYILERVPAEAKRKGV